ncbi:MAG: rod shape-determining protein MreD [Desulfobulbales bacterium]|nr:rod shape-determining protein MreD [Desulfobulbales bacterium]
MTVFIILGAILLLVQTTIFVRMPPWLGNPDLLFLLVLFVATRLDSYRGLILVMLYGLMMDIFSGFVPGLYPAVYLGLFLTIRYVSRQVIVDEPAHQPPLAATCYLLCSGAIYLYMAIFNPGTNILWSWRDLLLQMFILAILALPFFHVLSRIVARISVDRRRLFSRGRGDNRFIS